MRDAPILTSVRRWVYRGMGRARKESIEGVIYLILLCDSAPYRVAAKQGYQFVPVFYGEFRVGVMNVAFHRVDRNAFPVADILVRFPRDEPQDNVPFPLRDVRHVEDFLAYRYVFADGPKRDVLALTEEGDIPNHEEQWYRDRDVKTDEKDRIEYDGTDYAQCGKENSPGYAAPFVFFALLHHEEARYSKVGKGRQEYE
jgi:hypothetical protein